MPVIHVTDPELFSLAAYADGLRRHGMVVTSVDDKRIKAHLPPASDASVFQVEHWLPGGSITVTHFDDRLVTKHYRPHARIVAGSPLLGAWAFIGLPFAVSFTGRLFVGLGVGLALAFIQYRSVHRAAYQFVFANPDLFGDAMTRDAPRSGSLTNAEADKERY